MSVRLEHLGVLGVSVLGGLCGEHDRTLGLD